MRFGTVIFRVNGQPILLSGVNLHDFSPDGGATVWPEVVAGDLKLMTQHNINAIRCSHYPKAAWFYDLCDRNGFYVIDEADLETHGFEWIQKYEWPNALVTQKNAHYIFIAPVVIVFTIFMLYPILRSLYLSFFELTSGEYVFVGLKKYKKLFQDEIFYKSLFNTFIFLIIQVPIMIGCALLIAVVVE